jgi:hypothetical protein
MTGVDTDLATLREHLVKPFLDIKDPTFFALDELPQFEALARVEAELSRLRENIKAEAVQTILAKEYGSAQHERAEAAEARCAELERERDALDEARIVSARVLQDVVPRDRYDALMAVHMDEQARCARLQQALRFYADPATYVEGNVPHPREFATFVTPIHDDEGRIAREALAGPDTPADKPAAPAAATTPTQSGGVPEGNDGAAGAAG